MPYVLMIFVDRFTLDYSVVDDAIVAARDFVTDSKAFTNINPTLLMNISYHNKIKPDSGHWSCWWTVTRTWWTIQMTGMSSCQHQFQLVRIISSKIWSGARSGMCQCRNQCQYVVILDMRHFRVIVGKNIT